jgi:hypothetical protein
MLKKWYLLNKENFPVGFGFSPVKIGLRIIQVTGNERDKTYRRVHV